MARIAGVDIPGDKQVAFSLPYVYGIGRALALRVCEQTKVNPATLARDAGRLKEAYQLADIRSFDLFPQTRHVETVSVFAARGAD